MKDKARTALAAHTPTTPHPLHHALRPTPAVSRTSPPREHTQPRSAPPHPNFPQRERGMLKTTPAITIEQYENEISNNYERPNVRWRARFIPCCRRG